MATDGDKIPILLSGIRPKNYSKKKKKQRRENKGPARGDRTGEIDAAELDARLSLIRARGSASATNLARTGGGVLERALTFSRSTNVLPSGANLQDNALDKWHEPGGHANNLVTRGQLGGSSRRDGSSAGAAAALSPNSLPRASSTTITMSSLPTAPRVTSFYAKLGANRSPGKKLTPTPKQKKNAKKRSKTTAMMKKKKKKKKGDKREYTDGPAATHVEVVEEAVAASHLPTDPSDYINIDPKDRQSPFAPKRHRGIMKNAAARARRHARSPVQKQADNDLDTLNRRMLKMGAGAAALDEFTGLVGKRLYMFGGFGVRREKPGAGRKGWRNIWDATSILTSQKTVPREDIERAEGCSYYLGDTHTFLLERRPHWHRVVTRHEEKGSRFALMGEHEMQNKKTRVSSGNSPQGEEHAPPQLNIAPLGRSDHTVDLVRGSFALVFGGKQRGRMHGGDANPLNDVCILDLHGSARRVWRTAMVGGKVISRRWGHASAVCERGNGFLMVVGGIAAAAPFGRMDPYLDDSHQTSIPRRENPNNHNKTLPIDVEEAAAAEEEEEKEDLGNSNASTLFHDDEMEIKRAEVMGRDNTAQRPAERLRSGKGRSKMATTSDAQTVNAAPGLIGALNIESLCWSVPKISTEEIPVRGAPGLGHITQRSSERIPYAICGHSMDKVRAWQSEDADDLLVFGGWEWTHNSRGKVEGPSLSEKLRLLRVSGGARPVVGWTLLSIADPAGRSPGPRANHASASNELGLFIFGGRCIHSKNRNQSVNMMRHGADTSLRLKYLNDLCVLVRVRASTRMEEDTGMIDEKLRDAEEYEEKLNEARSWDYKWGRVDVTGPPPRPRENAKILNVHNGSLLVHGGYSGVPGHCPPRDEHVDSMPPGTIDHPWLDDLFVLRVAKSDPSCGRFLTAAWTQVLTGPRSPSPRCGHSLLLVDVAKTDVSRCHFEGRGLSECVVGIQAQFTIKTFDEGGNPRWAGRDIFHVVVSRIAPSGEAESLHKEMFGYIDRDESVLPNVVDATTQPSTEDSFTACVRDQYDGSYVCSYTAMIAGSYAIHVTCNGEKLQQSPFSMWAQAGPATPMNSHVTEIDAVVLESDQDYPQFTLVVGESASIGVTTKDKYGNLRLRGGEAWRLKTHILSLSEDIDGDSATMLRWRHATPLTTTSLCKIVRDMFSSTIKKAAADMSSRIAITEGNMTLQVDQSATAMGEASWKIFSGKEARNVLKNFVSKQVKTPNPLSEHGSLNGLCEVEDVVERVFQRGRFMGGAYYVFSTTVKLTLLHSLDNHASGTDDSFFQNWSILFHAINPEGGEEFGLTIEETSALHILSAMGSKTVETFRSLHFNENDGQLQKQYMCDLDVPAVTGPAIVAVTMDGRHICGSPFKCNLRPADPDAKNSRFSIVVEQQQDRSPLIAGQRTPLSIAAYDKNGINRDTGGDWFFVRARKVSTGPGEEEGEEEEEEHRHHHQQDAPEHANDQVTESKVADHGDGSYSTLLELNQAGDWEVSVLCYMFPPELRGKAGGDAMEHIPNSPFRLSVKHTGICASKCVLGGIYSPRVEFISGSDRSGTRQVISTRVAPHRILAGEEVSFSMTARDVFGNIVPGKSDFVMQLVRPGGHDIFGTVETTRDSVALTAANGPTHRCRVTVQAAALYEMRIMHGFDPLPSMPIPLLVEPNRPDPACCELYSQFEAKTPIMRSLAMGQIVEAILVAKDRFGNVCDLTIDNFCARIIWPEDSVSAQEASDGRDTCEIQPLGNGTYKCRYGSARAGRLSLHFTHDGKHIRDSPVYVDVAAGTVDVPSFNCAGAAFLSTLRAGTRAHFTVFARDVNNNRLVSGKGVKLVASGKVTRWEIDPWTAREEKRVRCVSEWEKTRNDQLQRRVNRKSRRGRRRQQIADVKSRSKVYQEELRNKQARRHDQKMRMFSATMLIDSMCDAVAIADVKASSAERNRQEALREHKKWQHEKSRPRGEDETAFNVPEPRVPNAQSSADFVVASYRSLPAQNQNAYLQMINDLDDLKSDALAASRQRAENYGMDIDPEVSDDSEEDVGDYEEPHEFSEPISDVVVGNVIDMNDGTYAVDVLLKSYAIGDIVLNVVEESTQIHVSGSPFTLCPGEPDRERNPSQFEVVPNPDFDRYAGVPLKVRVRSKSNTSIPGAIPARVSCFLVPLPSALASKSHGTKNDKEEQHLPEFVYHAPPPDGAAVLGEAVQLLSEAPGSATVDFTHSILGATSYRVMITMDGEHLDGSPFDINIRGAKSCPHRCVTYGDGASFACVGQRTEFFICVCDVFGNLRMSGEDDVSVALSGSNAKGDVQTIGVSSYAPGIYQCHYVPTRSSSALMLDVLCNSIPVPASPLSVRVAPGAISAEKTTAHITVSKSVLSPTSALQLFEESKHGDDSTSIMRVHSGAPLRLVLHTRDAYGNLRSGAHSTNDADLLMVRWKRSDGSDVYTDSLKPKLISNLNHDAEQFGTLQCIFQLLKEGLYEVFVTAAEYTETRLGQYGCIKNVTDKPIQIRILPGRCHAPSSIVLPQDEVRQDQEAQEDQFVWDTETSATYSRFSRKKVMEIAMADSRTSMQLWCHGPYSRSRRSLDVLYHGIYTRARQEMQDEIIRNMLNSGPGTATPYFVLLTGLMGSGKRHTACWLDRAGRFPLESFLWVDPYQISLQLPELRDLFTGSTVPKANHRAIAATAREAGCIAEILVGEALFRKKSIVLSTATHDATWWQTWLESMSSLYPAYRFALLHVDSSAEDIFARRSRLQKLLPFQAPSTMKTVETSLKKQQQTIDALQGLELWEYSAVVRNNDKDLTTGPRLVSESGGQTWSVAPAPSEAVGTVDFSDLELEAIAWRDQLSQVWVDHARAMPRSRVPKKLQTPGFAKLLNHWRCFCEQWKELATAESMLSRNGLSSHTVSTMERSLWNTRPRLLLTAGDTAVAKVSVFDIHRNPIVNADATEIRVRLEEAAPDPTVASSAPLIRASSIKVDASSHPKLTCISTYEGDGSYTCRYGSNQAGIFKLCLENSVGEQVPGSPFWLNVLPDEMHASACTASGPGLRKIFSESELAIFSIRTYDKYGNAIQSGGHHFDVHIISSSIAASGRSNSSVGAGSENTATAISSKKAALRDALQHASKLEGEVEMLSSAHAAVLGGNAASGEVSDFGNGRYSVRFDPREVPVLEATPHQSFVVLVVAAESGEHISGSPFVVPCVKSKLLASQCNLHIDHISQVVAGNVYEAVIRVPDKISTELIMTPTLSIRPIWSGEESRLPSQAMCAYSSSESEITALFSVRESNVAPLMIEAAYGGALIRANGQAATIPAVVASFAVPAKCTVKQSLHLDGLNIAAAGMRNVFEIQARDRFGISLRSDDPGECRARVIGALATGIPIRLVSNNAGVWTFEYWVPEEFGLFGHSGGAEVALDVAVELWDAQREAWVQTGGSPFRVPVRTMLAEVLSFVDVYSKDAVKEARIKIWKGHKGEGTRVVVGCAGKTDGAFAIGDLRHFAPGPYTLEVEARGFFTRRFAVFVPEYEAPKTDARSHIVKQARGKTTNNDFELEPPTFKQSSSSDELPRLRVLQQGDIDLSDDKPPELKHLWWFAKKDTILAASMKSSGELIELNLDQCVALFGDDPKSNGTARIPTSYANYLESRTAYNRKIGDLRKSQDEGDEEYEKDAEGQGGDAKDSSEAGKRCESARPKMGLTGGKPTRWGATQQFCLVRNSIGMFAPHNAHVGMREQPTTKTATQLSKRSELLVMLSWNGRSVQGHSAPALRIKFQNSGGHTQALHLGADCANIERAKKEGLLASWSRKEGKGGCIECLCLRDIPSSSFSVSVVPLGNIFLDHENTEAFSFEDTLLDLSQSCATVQCFQRMGEVLKCVAFDAIHDFRKGEPAKDPRPMLSLEWSILTSLGVGNGRKGDTLCVDNRLRAAFGALLEPEVAFAASETGKEEEEEEAEGDFYSDTGQSSDAAASAGAYAGEIKEQNSNLFEEAAKRAAGDNRDEYDGKKDEDEGDFSEDDYSDDDYSDDGFD
jgi:hypothetical protein